MGATASQFQGMIDSVVSSQVAEVTLGKQPILADYGREVRNAINALPPEVSRGLMSDYAEPTQQLVAAMEGAIMSRELAIESVAQEGTLDKDWLARGGDGRKVEESRLGAEDDWNGTPSV